MFGSFLRACWLASHHQLYSGIGADIVMESITLTMPLGTQSRLPITQTEWKSSHLGSILVPSCGVGASSLPTIEQKRGDASSAAALVSKPLLTKIPLCVGRRPHNRVRPVAIRCSRKASGSGRVV